MYIRLRHRNVVLVLKRRYDVVGSSRTRENT